MDSIKIIFEISRDAGVRMWAWSPEEIRQNAAAADRPLPDFVVLISPEETTGSGYRTTLQTFDRA